MSWVDETLRKAAEKMEKREFDIEAMRVKLGGFVTDMANKYVDAGATPEESVIIVENFIEHFPTDKTSELERELMEHYLALWYDDVTDADDVDV